jgi:RNA polymerase sigma factor (sigma-70 family)
VRRKGRIASLRIHSEKKKDVCETIFCQILSSSGHIKDGGTAVDNDWELLSNYIEDASQAAFYEIVVRYTPMVFASAARRAGSELAADISQGVFMILAQKAPDLIKSKRGTIAGWLYRATRYASAEALRRRRRYTEHDGLAEPQDPRPQGPIDEIAWREIRPVLDKALDSLRPADRDAVLLRYIQGESYRAIGSSLGITENNATKRVERAIAKLQRFFLRNHVSVALPVLAGLMATRTTHAVTRGVMQRCIAAGSETTLASSALAGATAKAMVAAKIKALASYACTTLAASVLTMGTVIHVTRAIEVRNLPFRLESITPLTLLYAGHAILPDGSAAYQINSHRGRRTLFVKEGDSIEGLLVAKHRWLSRPQVIPGIGKESIVNISELTLTDRTHTYLLTRGTSITTKQCIAWIDSPQEKTNIVLKAGDSFTAGDDSFLAVSLEKDKGRLVVRRMRDGKEISVRHK